MNIYQINVRMFGASNLYWESYSGQVLEKSDDNLHGLLRFCVFIIPVACLPYITIFIYIRIIKVCQYL